MSLLCHRSILHGFNCASEDDDEVFVPSSRSKRKIMTLVEDDDDEVAPTQVIAKSPRTSINSSPRSPLYMDLTQPVVRSDSFKSSPTQKSKDKADTNSIHNETLSTSPSSSSSSGLECGICLDKVVERGIMSGCDHPFCFTCIHQVRSVFKPFCMSLWLVHNH